MTYQAKAAKVYTNQASKSHHTQWGAALFRA